MTEGKRGDDHSQELGAPLVMLLGLGGRECTVLILLASASGQGFHAVVETFVRSDLVSFCTSAITECSESLGFESQQDPGL